MDKESKNFLLLLASSIGVIGFMSYVFFWGGLITQPAVNIVEQKTREQNPLVIKTQQDRAIEIVSDIERKQRNLVTLDRSSQELEKASIEALRSELKRSMGTLRADQVPDSVKAFLTSDK